MRAEYLDNFLQHMVSIVVEARVVPHLQDILKNLLLYHFVRNCKAGLYDSCAISMRTDISSKISYPATNLGKVVRIIVLVGIG